MLKYVTYYRYFRKVITINTTKIEKNIDKIAQTDIL